MNMAHLLASSLRVAGKSSMTRFIGWIIDKNKIRPLQKDYFCTQLCWQMLFIGHKLRSEAWSGAKLSFCTRPQVMQSAQNDAPINYPT